MKKVGIVIALMLFAQAGAVDAVAAVIGKVRNVSGEAFLVRDGNRTAAKVGDDVESQDTIETSADGAIGVTFNDSTVFSAGPNSNVSMETFQFNPETLKGAFLANLRKGTLSVISGDIARGSPEAMKIKTPSAVLGVRGTTFLVRVNEDGQ